MVKTLATLLIVFSSWTVSAQTEPQNNGSVPIYRITVVGRTIKAINYRHRSGSTKIDFQGTSLLPRARGNAEVQSKQGATHIDAEFKDLQPATQFGPEYLTYVLWAISPEGRPVNLGEVLLNSGGKSKLDVTSNLQAFGLIVTAEPYFAVTQPSDVVVMENRVRSDTTGTIEQVDAKFELLRRGQYELNVSPADLQPMVMNSKTPLELYEARNAVRIAKWTGADRYAAGSLSKAETDLQNAESYQLRKSNKKSEITEAREAVQTAEDARAITVKKMDTERRENERQASADAQARSKAEADQATQRKEQAEAETAKAKAETAQTQATAGAAVAQANAATQQADNRAQQAENDKAAMRGRLLQQLNLILQTRDSSRGLVVNMSDVLFGTGKYTLKSGTREKLAKVAGVLLAYPGLNIEVDGYTDNVGSVDSNQKLSDQRAASVHDYLVREGVASSSLTAKGLGESEPIGSNDTSAGRQMNRRVELVVSGDVIGTQVTAASAGGLL
ncbi:MAG TPA: OmpA family protein [Terriglobia bacterium]|nr:OmpA family protein [Terriglobia bacterium]